MKPIIGQSPGDIPQDHPLVLQYQLAYVRHTLNAASQRKERLEDLMSRHIAKKWDAGKKSKMVRRLVTANQTIEQCVGAVDELTKKFEAALAKLGPTPTNIVAPFVRGPATSLEGDLTSVPELFDTPAPAGLETPFGP